MSQHPVSMGTNFPTTLVNEMFSKVKGHSSIAKMVPSSPIAFTGNTEFTFSPDHAISVVGENGAKPQGDATVAPVVIRPIKVVYQSRVSNEFLIAAAEKQLDYLTAFTDGFAKMVAAGMDEMIMHGVDPYTGNAASTIIGNNHLDYVIANYSSGANKIVYGHDSSDADANVEEAIAKVEDANGIILGKTIRGAIAALTTNNGAKYPEFAWGATPAELGGMTLDSNKTVESNSAKARAYVGDWSALKWGFAAEMPLEVIEYGDPDGQGDLKRYNQVMLRSEAFIGWGILDQSAFAGVFVNP